MDGQKYIQLVSAFKCKDKLIMTSSVKVTEGLWYIHPPLEVIYTNATLLEIGKAVFDALGRSQIGFPAPPSSAEMGKAMNCLVKAVGVQTSDDILKVTLHCIVGRDTKGFEITPTHIGGLNDVHFLLERRIMLEADVSPEQLGTAFLQGFAACTSIYE
ncbi:MAG: hypothetical protein SXV54_09885 [Chloroflexota bacterium]|nr:hypothetical protein [Chloroflexota bacterium]